MLSVGDIYEKIYERNKCKLPFLFGHHRYPLNPQFLSLFRNLNQCEIKIDEYRWDLLSFLDVIDSNSKDISYGLIGAGESWITTSVLFKYIAKGWSITYEGGYGISIINNKLFESKSFLDTVSRVNAVSVAKMRQRRKLYRTASQLLQFEQTV